MFSFNFFKPSKIKDKKLNNNNNNKEENSQKNLSVNLNDSQYNSSNFNLISNNDNNCINDDLINNSFINELKGGSLRSKNVNLESSYISSNNIGKEFLNGKNINLVYNTSNYYNSYYNYNDKNSNSINDRENLDLKNSNLNSNTNNYNYNDINTNINNRYFNIQDESFLNNSNIPSKDFKNSYISKFKINNVNNIKDSYSINLNQSTNNENNLSLSNKKVNSFFLKNTSNKNNITFCNDGIDSKLNSKLDISSNKLVPTYRNDYLTSTVEKTFPLNGNHNRNNSINFKNLKKESFSNNLNNKKRASHQINLYENNSKKKTNISFNFNNSIKNKSSKLINDDSTTKNVNSNLNYNSLTLNVNSKNNSLLNKISGKNCNSNNAKVNQLPVNLKSSFNNKVNHSYRSIIGKKEKSINNKLSEQLSNSINMIINDNSKNNKKNNNNEYDSYNKCSKLRLSHNFCSKNISPIKDINNKRHLSYTKNIINPINTIDVATNITNIPNKNYEYNNENINNILNSLEDEEDLSLDSLANSLMEDDVKEKLKLTKKNIKSVYNGNIQEENLDKVIEDEFNKAKTANIYNSKDYYLYSVSEACRKLKKTRVIYDSLSEDEDVSDTILMGRIKVNFYNFSIYAETFNFILNYQLFIHILSIFHLILLPIDLCFEPLHNNNVYYINFYYSNNKPYYNIFVNSNISLFSFYYRIIYDFYFIINFTINLFIGYGKNKHYFTKQALSLCYEKEGFLLDLFIVIPYEIFYLIYCRINNVSLLSLYITTSSKNEILLLSSLRWFKILNLFKIQKFFKYININFELSQIFYLINFSLFYILYFHASTCLWIYLAAIEDFYNQDNWMLKLNFINKNNFDIYIASLYFNFATLFTVGYGDITPTNPKEVMYGLLLVVISYLVFTVLFSTISTYFNKNALDQHELGKKENILMSIKDEHDVPSKLSNKIMKYYSKIVGIHNHGGKSILLDALPNLLKYELLFEMYGKTIKKIKFFQNSSDEFNFFVLSLLKPLSLEKDETLLTVGDTFEDIFFVVKGQLNFFLLNFNTNKSKKFFSVIKGQNFGEISILDKETIDYEINCSKNRETELLLLSKNDLCIIKANYPDAIKDKIKSSLANYERMEKNKSLYLSKLKKNLKEDCLNKNLDRFNYNKTSKLKVFNSDIVSNAYKKYTYTRKRRNSVYPNLIGELDTGLKLDVNTINNSVSNDSIDDFKQKYDAISNLESIENNTSNIKNSNSNINYSSCLSNNSNSDSNNSNNNKTNNNDNTQKSKNFIELNKSYIYHSNNIDAKDLSNTVKKNYIKKELSNLKLLNNKEGLINSYLLNNATKPFYNCIALKKKVNISNNNINNLTKIKNNINIINSNDKKAGPFKIYYYNKDIINDLKKLQINAVNNNNKLNYLEKKASNKSLVLKYHKKYYKEDTDKKLNVFQKYNINNKFKKYLESCKIKNDIVIINKNYKEDFFYMLSNYSYNIYNQSCMNLSFHLDKEVYTKKNKDCYKIKNILNKTNNNNNIQTENKIINNTSNINRKFIDNNKENIILKPYCITNKYSKFNQSYNIIKNNNFSIFNHKKCNILGKEKIPKSSSKILSSVNQINYVKNLNKYNSIDSKKQIKLNINNNKNINQKDNMEKVERYYNLIDNVSTTNLINKVNNQSSYNNNISSRRESKLLKNVLNSNLSKKISKNDLSQLSAFLLNKLKSDNSPINQKIIQSKIGPSVITRPTPKISNTNIVKNKNINNNNHFINKIKEKNRRLSNVNYNISPSRRLSNFCDYTASTIKNKLNVNNIDKLKNTPNSNNEIIDDENIYKKKYTTIYESIDIESGKENNIKTKKSVNKIRNSVSVFSTRKLEDSIINYDI